MIELRNYQKELVESVREEVKKGHKKIIMTLPTGGGKSFIAADIAARSVEKGHKVLILTHMRQLVTQMSLRLSEYGLDSGFIMAGFESELNKSIQIGTIQTYSRRIKLPDEIFFINASIVIIDEAHKSMSKTYQTVLSKYTDKIVIGITATPVLGSGVGLGEFYSVIVDRIGVHGLIDIGQLVPVRYFAPDAPDLSKIKIVRGDYDKKELGDKMSQPKIVGDVYEQWAKVAGGKQTMVFAVNVKHSKYLRDKFLSYGIKAEHLDAHNEDDERSETIRRFRNGDTQVLCNVGLFTEGTDIPEIECISIARPTKSLGLYRQMGGRGLRPSNGKTECILIDHGGCVQRLGFLEEEIEWSLSGKEIAYRAKKKKKKEDKILTCDMCQCAFTGPVCKNCGHKVEDYGKKIASVDAELIELKKPKQMSKDEKRRWYGMIEYYRRSKGTYSPGWTAHKYKEKTGVWPKNLEGVILIEPDKECLNWLKYQNIRWAKSKRNTSNENRAGVAA